MEMTSEAKNILLILKDTGYICRNSNRQLAFDRKLIAKYNQFSVKPNDPNIIFRFLFEFSGGLL